MDKKTRVTVFVAGQRFNIITEKSEKYVIDIADRIDARINSLMISGDMSREKASVLTALDFADDNENDKENLTAVKEQIKDYLTKIESLSAENIKLNDDYKKLKEEYERLVAEQKSAEKFADTAEKDKAEITALNKEIESLKAELKAEKEKKAVEPKPQETEKISEITADDDLFFDEPEEEPVKPQKDKKKRHEHSHTNPYQQKAQQKEQKGYTQQRQYTFFDIEEE